MADQDLSGLDNNLTPQDTDDSGGGESGEELHLEAVLDIEPDQLTDEQKTLIEENKDNLTDDQKEKFGVKDEEPEPLKPEDIKPETRFKTPKVKKIKEEEEEIAPEDEETIGRVLEKKLKPYQKMVVSQTDRGEVNEFIADKPEYAKYKEVALKYMANPAYKNIPVFNIMAIVSAKDQQRLGAMKERQAQQKATQTKGADAQPARKTGGGKTDWHTAPKEAFEAQMAKVKGYQV